MRTRATTVTLAGLLALYATAAGPALAAPASDTTHLRITTQEQLDAQLRGQGLAHRHLPTCQAQPSATPSDVMASLEYLAGHWEGLGTESGQDGTHSYVQTEDIRFTDPHHLDINGTGHDPANLANVTFRAHAVASPRADGSIQWLASSGGHDLDTTMVVLDDGWRWDVPMGPGMLVRYETHYTHGGRAWHETGQITMDGGHTWRTIQEMTLVKTCDL